jgi:hypothetical protein
MARDLGARPERLVGGVRLDRGRPETLSDAGRVACPSCPASLAWPTCLACPYLPGLTRPTCLTCPTCPRFSAFEI